MQSLIRSPCRDRPPGAQQLLERLGDGAGVSGTIANAIPVAIAFASVVRSPNQCSSLAAKNFAWIWFIDEMAYGNNTHDLIVYERVTLEAAKP